MGSHIASFKKFMKSEEKKAEEIGAAPMVDEQAAPAAPGAGDNIGGTATPAATPPAAPVVASVEANPAVIAARQAAAAAVANRDKVVSAKQAELDKLKTDQDTLVNTANTNLNKALQDAGKATAA